MESPLKRFQRATIVAIFVVSINRLLVEAVGIKKALKSCSGVLTDYCTGQEAGKAQPPHRRMDTIPSPNCSSVQEAWVSYSALPKMTSRWQQMQGSRAAGAQLSAQFGTLVSA